MEWNKAGIPHKGWSCVDVEDIAEYFDDAEEIEYEQCEMCGRERIRFVHIMRHPDYPDELRVGCVCAEKMSDDYVNPRRAEDTLKKRAVGEKISIGRNGVITLRKIHTAKSIRVNI